jgi:Uma2 family endonuclease
MNMIATASSIPIDTWVTAPWDEFLRLADDPSHTKSKGYYHHGRMRFESMSTGSDHSDVHAIILFAISFYAAHCQLPFKTKDACSYRKVGHSEFQPDISCYAAENAMVIPFGTRVVDLDTYPLPNLVIEISDTTLSDDKGEKRLQYEELGIAEYWIVDVQKCEIIAFEITAIGVSRRIQVSQVLPGLAFDLLATTLKRSREEDQSTTMAWLMGQINHVIN